MAITSAYVRENEYYSVDSLKELFCFTPATYKTQNEADKRLTRFLKELLSRNILKERSKTNNGDADVEFEKHSDDDLLSPTSSYKFDFVGIIICEDVIAYSYPKYIGEEKSLPQEAPITEMQQVMQVIEKYSREKAKQDVRDVDLFADIDDKGTVNTLSVMLFLLEDYAANGEYEDNEEILEINGSGDIYWQKTIDETYPIISNNRPYYVELYTRKKISNDASFIKRLHAYVVTQCSNEIEKAGLTAFYSLPCADISDEEQDNFGEDNNIINRIEIELTHTFNDRKKSVLRAMMLYFLSEKILVGDTEMHVMGTRSFNLIWEEVCAKVFRSQKDDTVDTITPHVDYTLINQNFDHKPPTLVELIEKPIWKNYDKSIPTAIPSSTFKPDSLRFEHKNTGKSYTFYILDAKYYCPVWKSKIVNGQEKGYIEGQPGVEDVAKQYLYYLAYREVLNRYHVTEVKNYFLMPKRKSDNIIPGFVKLNMLKELGLGVIEVRMLPPSIMYDSYLNNSTLNLTELH